MNIILCMVRTDIPIEATCPPMGILSLAPILQKAGHQVKVVLPIEYYDFYSDLVNNLKNCDIFGISSTSYNWYITRELIFKIHQVNPRIKIVLGGVHPTFYHRYCLSSTPAHIVVRYEGEISFPEVVDALSRKLTLEHIQGITYKNEDGDIISTPLRSPLTETQLNQMPLPAYQLIPPNKYGYIPFESSRGCYHHCTFCGVYFHKSHRDVSKERLANLIQSLKRLPDRFLQKGIFFTDDSFGANKKHYTDILNLFSETDFLLGLEGRSDDLIHNDLLPLLEKNKLYLLQVGVETGYPDGIKVINKDIYLHDVVRFADRCAHRNFSSAIYYSMTIGFPWEREQHLLQTINFAYELAIRSASPSPMLNNFNPLPGSRMLESPEKYGMPKIEPPFYDDGNWFRPFLYFTSLAPESRHSIQQYMEYRKSIHPHRQIK